MLRRRCTPLTRTMLTAAFGAAEPDELARLRTVFSSRHGSINESIGLLENVVRREKLSPATFSHTVHNAQAGLFSIAAGNRAASSYLSAQEDSFLAGWLEALCFLERDPREPVLLVVGDVPLAETFAPLVDEAATPRSRQIGRRGRGRGRARTGPHPHGLAARVELLRWWLGGGSSSRSPRRPPADWSVDEVHADPFDALLGLAVVVGARFGRGSLRFRLAGAGELLGVAFGPAYQLGNLAARDARLRHPRLLHRPSPATTVCGSCCLARCSRTSA